MKKNEQDKTTFNSDNIYKKKLETDKIKTTNINILLNRVRLDKKRTFKKKVIFSILLVSIVSSLSIYLIIW